MLKSVQVKAKYTNPLMFDRYVVGEKTLYDWKTYFIIDKKWVSDSRKSFYLILQLAE